MTKFLDGVLPPIAQKLLKRFGKTLPYTPKTVGAYDAHATASTNGETSSYDVNGIVEDFDLLRETEFQSSQVQRGDKKATCAALDFQAEPVSGDKMVVGSQPFIVIQFQTVYSGDDPALYVLQLRKS